MRKHDVLPDVLPIAKLVKAPKYENISCHFYGIRSDYFFVRHLGDEDGVDFVRSDNFVCSFISIFPLYILQVVLLVLDFVSSFISIFTWQI